MKFWFCRKGQIAPKRLHPPTDWTSPRSTIVVVGAQRSGTTLLCSLMEATGQLGRPAEFFNAGSRNFALRYNNDGALEKVDVTPSHLTANGVFALKLFPNHLEDAARVIHLWEFFPNPVFVRVYREDLLGQAISLARAWQTKKWNSRGSESSVRPTYSKQDIERALAEITNENARWDRYFARNQIVPLRVRYEDMEQNIATILHEIASLVGVTLPSTLTLEDSDLKIQRDEISEKWKNNFLADAGSLDLIN